MTSFNGYYLSTSIKAVIWQASVPASVWLAWIHASNSTGLTKKPCLLKSQNVSFCLLKDISRHLISLIMSHANS